MELEAHIEGMHAVRANRLLDGAQVAAYPVYLQHDRRHAQDWWRRLVEQAQDTLASVTERISGGRPAFLLNGVAVGFRELKEKLGAALGAGSVA